MRIPHLFVGRELPGLSLFWLDTIGDPVDLSAGYSFGATIEQDRTTTALTATIQANANPTADTQSSADVPTVQLNFAAGAIDALTVGPAVLRVVATSGGRDRVGRWELEIGE